MDTPETELSEEFSEMSVYKKRKLAEKILRQDKDKSVQALVFNKDALIAEKCRRNFYFFVQTFISELIPGEVVLNWHVKYLCNLLQPVIFRIIARLPAESDIIINVAPGTSKSTIVSQLLPAWAWIAVLPETQEYKKTYEIKRKAGKLRPDNEDEKEKRIYGGFMRFCGVSYNEDAALANARKHKAVVECDKYMSYFPELRIKKDSSGIRDFWNTQGGQRWSVGINGGVTGQHFDCKIPDDPMNPLSSDSERKASGANTYFDETLSSRNTDQDVTMMIVVMQRLGSTDTTGHLISKAKKNPDMRPINHICLPVTYQEYIKPEECKKYYKARGGFFDPIRRGKQAIATLRANLGPYAAAGQLDQVPVARGTGLFDADRIVEDVPKPPLHMIEESVRYWDKAATAGGGDYTCGALMHRMKRKYDGPQYIIEDMERGQWSSTKRNQKIRQTAVRDKNKFGENIVNWIEQEPGSGGKESAEITIRELAGFRVKTETKQPSTGQRVGKTGRAEPYADQVYAGNVGFCDGKWNNIALEEMALAPKGAHNDTWDSSAGAFNKLALGTKQAGTW